ncbi:hypothetical protein E4U52_005624, partial [Claviceps spartinae]
MDYGSAVSGYPVRAVPDDFHRVNRRAMDIVDALPVPQYTALIKHCPNIVRAILSIKADAFDYNVLYRTLSTFSCSTCERFGDRLYLIDCRRVCYQCFMERLEYFPLTVGRASKLVTHDMIQRRAEQGYQQSSIPTGRRSRKSQAYKAYLGNISGLINGKTGRGSGLNSFNTGSEQLWFSKE